MNTLTPNFSAEHQEQNLKAIQKRKGVEIVNRWFKQEVKHDTLYKLQHDTITVKVKETVTVKEKTTFPWLWLIIGGIVLLFFLIANRKL